MRRPRTKAIGEITHEQVHHLAIGLSRGGGVIARQAVVAPVLPISHGHQARYDHLLGRHRVVSLRYVSGMCIVILASSPKARPGADAASQDLIANALLTDQPTLSLTAGGMAYSIDLRTMIQSGARYSTRRLMGCDRLDSTLHVWCWLDDHSHWQPYSPEVSEALDKAVESNQTKVTMNMFRWQYTIDLVALTQSNLGTGKVRPMRRPSRTVAEFRAAVVQCLRATLARPAAGRESTDLGDDCESDNPVEQAEDDAEVSSPVMVGAHHHHNGGQPLARHGKARPAFRGASHRASPHTARGGHGSGGSAASAHTLSPRGGRAGHVRGAPVYGADAPADPVPAGFAYGPPHGAYGAAASPAQAHGTGQPTWAPPATSIASASAPSAGAGAGAVFASGPPQTPWAMQPPPSTASSAAAPAGWIGPSLPTTTAPPHSPPPWQAARPSAPPPSPASSMPSTSSTSSTPAAEPDSSSPIIASDVRSYLRPTGLTADALAHETCVVCMCDFEDVHAAVAAEQRHLRTHMHGAAHTVGAATRQQAVTARQATGQGASGEPAVVAVSRSATRPSATKMEEEEEPEEEEEEEDDPTREGSEEKVGGKRGGGGGGDGGSSGGAGRGSGSSGRGGSDDASLQGTQTAATPTPPTPFTPTPSSWVLALTDDTPVALRQCHGHYFHCGCAVQALQAKPKCPVCGMIYGAVTGTQPAGTMHVVVHAPGRAPLSGHERDGTIVITYQFPSGTQGPEHPQPGSRYHGTHRTALLPDSAEGREVLALLRRAFDARLTFTVGRSITTGMDNCVVWAGIHHKTNSSGGAARHGYPDPTYFSRVKAELASVGIQ